MVTERGVVGVAAIICCKNRQNKFKFAQIVCNLCRGTYAISFCLARSSAFSMGVIILSTVRKAARLAV